MQKALLESIKSKRMAQMESAHGGGLSGDVEGESFGEDKSDELAPQGAHGAKLSDMGKADQEAHQGPDTRNADMQNINANAAGKGIQKGGPVKNSKDMFVDTKKPIHVPANNNKDKMIAGNGLGSQKKDNLGMDSNKEPRLQGAKDTKGNFFKGLKEKAAMAMKAKMDVKAPSKFSKPDQSSDTESESDQQDADTPEFSAPDSRLDAGQGDDSAPSNPQRGIAAARAAMARKMKA
jgi:hypothetical protein